MAATNPSGAAQEKTSPDRRTEKTAGGADWTVSSLRFSSRRGSERMVILIRSCHTRDAKWIAGWFKRTNNCASKSKRQTGTVGRHLSGSQTTPPTQCIDGLDPVKSPSESESLAEPTTSESGTGMSPNVFSTPLEHTSLFSRSGVQVVPENGRSAAGHGPYHSRLHSGWELELEYPAVAPGVQGNRELGRSLFYPHSHGANPVALPRPHTDLVDSQIPLGVVTNSHAYLTPQVLSPSRHGTSSPNTGTGIDNFKSCNPQAHSSPSPTGTLPGALQTPTRYVQVNLVPERSDAAYTKLELELQADLGPGPGAGVRAVVEAPGTNTHVDLSQAQAVPDFVAPTESQFGPSESSTPLPSMYWLLFDTELDSIVDREQDDVVSRSPSRGIIEPHVTPTPISFFAKWEDMLALERRIRSSSHSAKPVQSKRTNPGGPCHGA